MIPTLSNPGVLAEPGQSSEPLTRSLIGNIRWAEKSMAFTEETLP